MDKELSILCFGNSLTAGYYHFGCDYHPYALTLKDKLQAAFPTTTFTVDVDGLPGDLVISPVGTFLPRIQAKFDGSNYDWVIILGGTNDLGRGYPVSKIYPALQEAWEVALDSGANVLVLTIPECSVVSTTLDARRNEVNSSILSHKAEGFHAFDLHGKVPYHSATEEFRKKIWDDGLHLTAEGYKLVGEVVGEHLIALLKDKGL
ncbi:hypothetical protein ALT_1042 [Aspergillus lentulus]|uniref:SGNH hydrolase-type esterase domain-containing protein n=1 Tax=Aspergillus lentulus TaxID=293939 RepID=A0AAN5YHV2_ASPLE|nr:uncharacterized protein IFM58399_09938 [Aspergillus lentulus]KAF4178515.1 hypothetical protein CNMCM7927_002435 [Aspergillus lentulus]KAF4201876.1 hypothetical protein CNMCM8927_000964 [Aspergillus lentulus]GAQ03721.1 hypothetical protein ALT_1042 [Aspergillus lentulus]GFF54887.1 hypothetical protein IFM58399_09938 [Aspergillus lentulus]GFF60171.1 hypothetical protein IFM62136_04480 [Aspergillus lentulus]